MKILFPLVSAGSGSDVFVRNLVSGLTHTSVSAGIQYLPSWSGYSPYLAGKLCNLSGYEVIHANTWNGYGFKQVQPLVVTEHHVVHDTFFTPYTTLAQRAYYRLIYHNERKSLDSAESVTAVSRYTQKKLNEVFGYSSSKMIYNGIDTSLFSPASVQKSELGIDDETIVLLYVGNHLRRKGADLLEPIMHKLGDDFLLLTTSGLRTKGTHLSKNIRPLGKTGIQDLVRAYNLCDILLFPSRLEGFGLCVAEAMACEKPVITTNSSSLPELVEQDK
jgi:glycosyltransferase involved in cell wall biosynthesis